jgi:hypothetical protein
MRNLFRAFDRRKVRHLVISGQAAVLYGAAHFSQDLDLWVDPRLANVARLLRALADLRAVVHKLTPPITPANVRRGHGFHFVVPNGGGGRLYLDVMGRPPRVGSFDAAARRANRVRTPWGRLTVVAIEDLVELKKTNRPADYDVITRLALLRLNEEASPRPRTLRWALEHVFNPDDLWAIVTRHGSALGGRLPVPAARLRAAWRRGEEPTADEMSRAGEELARRAHRLQDRGRRYWMPVIAELRRLRREGRLVPEGTPVRVLVT